MTLQMSDISEKMAQLATALLREHANKLLCPHGFTPEPIVDYAAASLGCVSMRLRCEDCDLEFHMNATGISRSDPSHGYKEILATSRSIAACWFYLPAVKAARERDELAKLIGNGVKSKGARL